MAAWAESAAVEGAARACAARTRVCLVATLTQARATLPMQTRARATPASCTTWRRSWRSRRRPWRPCSMECHSHTQRHSHTPPRQLRAHTPCSMECHSHAQHHSHTPPHQPRAHTPPTQPHTLRHMPPHSFSTSSSSSSPPCPHPPLHAQHRGSSSSQLSARTAAVQTTQAKQSAHTAVVKAQGRQHQQSAQTAVARAVPAGEGCLLPSRAPCLLAARARARKRRREHPRAQGRLGQKVLQSFEFFLFLFFSFLASE